MRAIAIGLRPFVRGWGRLAAWLVLLLFVALQVWAGALFEPPRLAFFDLVERAAPRRLDAAPVVIVAIDDRSLAQIGQWPWPRQILAELIGKIESQHPTALGLDMFWSEPDKTSPEEWLRQAGTLPASLSDELSLLPSHDDALRDALAAAPVAVGVAGDQSAGAHADAGILAPVRVIGADGGGDPLARLPHFGGAIRSIPKLDHAAAGHGLMSVTPDADGVYRRLPMLSVVSGRPAPGLALEMLRLAVKAPWIELHVAGSEIAGIGVGRLALPTGPDGSIWVDFTPHDPRRFVSAADVLAGLTPAGQFDQRLVLLGVTGLGEVDQRKTPLDSMVGTEVHAEFLENVIAARLARRPGWAAALEPGLTLIFGIVLIVAVPRLRPSWQFPLLLSAIGVLGCGGYLCWSRLRLLVDVATPMLGQGAVMLALLAGGLAEADAQRRRLRRELELGRLSAAHTEGELAAGRRIQMGILPTPDTVAGDPRFDLAALMVPARQIGGDLYDFFKIDPDHLFLAVGDVSGKGVPASLFMAVGKSLFKSCALRGESDIGAIIDRANAEISRDNPEMLFITAFAGILDLTTGMLRFCNAGQDPPYLISRQRSPRDLATEPGPPLCVIEDFPYTAELVQLQPGDLLCITTDGVTEAMTADGALTGRERVATILADLPPDTDARTLIERLQEGVAAYVAGAEPSDDLTILVLRWQGVSAP